MVNITPQIDHPLLTTSLFPYYQLSEYQFSTFATTIVHVTTGNTLTSNVLSSNGIPKRIYIFVKYNQTDQSPTQQATTPDCYALITQVSFQWNNMPSVLSDANAYDLYLLSVRNGCDMTWQQWNSFVGSVVCINPCSDLPSLPHQASGLAERTSFQVKVTYNSISPNDSTYTLYIEVIDEGLIVVNNQVVSHETNPLTTDNVVNATEAHGSVKISNLFGGYSYKDIMGSIKHGIHRAASIAEPMLQKIAEYGVPIARGIKDLTAGGRRRRARRCHSQSRRFERTC